MVDIGDLDINDKVNSRATKLFIRPSGSDLEYVQLQEKDLRVAHPALVEHTTSGGTTAYSGGLQSTLTGSILFTTDLEAAIGGFTEISTPANGQLPSKIWKLKLTDFNGTLQTWEVNAILEDFRINGAAEGGTKYDIALRITTEPVIT